MPFRIHLEAVRADNVPDEVTETEDENGDTCELDRTREIGAVHLDQLRENGGQGQGAKPLCERNHGGTCYGRIFPKPGPILRRSEHIGQSIGHERSSAIHDCLWYGEENTHEGIMLAVGRLGNEHAVRTGGRLDEVMFADIHHDLGTRQDLDVELLLELMQHLT